jgi:lipoprotein signal peptidase
MFWNLSPNLQISAFGLSTNNPKSLIGIFIIFVLLLNAVSAFSILFENKDAIIITKLNVIIGIAVCLISMIVLPILSKSYSFSPRFEILLLILIYKKLKQIEGEK